MRNNYLKIIKLSNFTLLICFINLSLAMINPVYGADADGLVNSINDVTYITTLENGKLVIVDTISKKRIWSHHTENKISQSHTILYLGRKFQHNEYLEIKGNKITLVRYK